MRIINTLFACLPLLLSQPLLAEDFHAQQFHDQNCMKCHGTEVYTRGNRRVTSLPALDNQVARCDANLGIKLFPEEQTALVDYLNSAFYGFEK